MGGTSATGGRGASGGSGGMSGSGAMSTGGTTSGGGDTRGFAGAPAVRESIERKRRVLLWTTRRVAARRVLGLLARRGWWVLLPILVALALWLAFG